MQLEIKHTENNLYYILIILHFPEYTKISTMLVGNIYGYLPS